MSIATLLRTLAAEHRPRIKEALFGRAAIEAFFDIRAHDAGCALGPQRDGAFRLVAIDERVHLLLDDIGSFAGRAREQIDPLENRNPDLAKVVAQRDRARTIFDVAHQ